MKARQLMHTDISYVTVPSTQRQPKSHTISLWFKQISKHLVNALIQGHEPKIKLFRNRGGQAQWQVYDPLSYQTVWLNSETEVRSWIEQRYYNTGK